MPQREASWLEVVVGSMFSGKSEELIRRVKRALIAKQKVMVFKPALDHRYGVEKVAAHNGLSIDCIPVQQPEEILEQVDQATDVVAIDEVQFFPPSIVEVCQQLVKDEMCIRDRCRRWELNPHGLVPTAP